MRAAQLVAATRQAMVVSRWSFRGFGFWVRPLSRNGKANRLASLRAPRGEGQKGIKNEEAKARYLMRPRTQI